MTNEDCVVVVPDACLVCGDGDHLTVLHDWDGWEDFVGDVVACDSCGATCELSAYN